MDAAQMLTAQEIARQCEYLASITAQRAAGTAADHADQAEPALPEQSRRGRHLRLADPITQPIERITEPAPERADEPEPDASVDGGLTTREWGVLAFERQWWKREGAKERAIRELFDLSPSRYYQVLNALIDKPEALRVDPMLVKRLRRARRSRQRQRDAGGRAFVAPPRETEE